MSISRRGLFGLREQPRAPAGFSLTGFYRQRARDGAANGDEIPVAPRREGANALLIATTKVGVCDRPAWRKKC